MSSRKSALWVRHHLRLHDNPVMNSFCENSDEGMFFSLVTKSERRAKSSRKDYIEHGFQSFQARIFPHELKRYNEISELELSLVSAQVTDLYFAQGYSPEEQSEEVIVSQLCQKLGIKLHGQFQGTLFHLNDLPFEVKKMPDVFTAFRQKIESHQIQPLSPLAPRKLPKPIYLTQAKPQVVDLEQQALQRVEDYFKINKRVYSYKETRNGMIDYDDSTKISSYLSLGLLSPRYVYEQLMLLPQQNDSTYWVFFELLWRDYFKFLSLKYGKKIYLNAGITGKKNVADRDEKKIDDWKNGKTGHDFIDANMRELKFTGWMSNRGRQNVASYLIHHLGQPWTLGASYFEEMLIDYDPESNWGNWLYLSGHGTDPRSRVFNPDKQAQDYDALGLYRKKWLSE